MYLSELYQDEKANQEKRRDGLRPNGLRFSCRLAAFANTNELRVVVDSKTQKSPDLARRKAVNCNRLFGG